MSSEDFVTRLGMQLHEAALREERRGALGSRLAGLRYALPRGTAIAVGALAAVLVAAVIALGGLDWGSSDRVARPGPRVVQTFTLADKLGNTMGVGFGAVWAIDAEEGRMLRVDPRTHDVRARIPIAPVSVVNVGAGAAWAIEYTSDVGAAPIGRLVRIDPATNRVTSRAPLTTPGGGEFNPIDVLFARGAPWVVGVQGALRIDRETGRPVSIVAIDPSEGEPFPLWSTVDDDYLWVLTRDQRIVRYDLATGRRVQQQLPARLPGATGLVPTPAGPVLSTPGGEVARVDPATGALAWRRSVGTSLTFPPGLEGDTLWAHAAASPGGRDRLVALDMVTGDTRSATPLPEFGIAGSAFLGREIWVATPTGRVMVLRR